MKVDNLIQRQFEASKPMEKCHTDVTEFVIPASTQKLYLSPVLDGFNSEIIAYSLSASPNLARIKTMLEQAIIDYIDYYNNKRIKVKRKHTKISSEEISNGRKYSLLFRYVKVEVSC